MPATRGLKARAAKRVQKDVVNRILRGLPNPSRHRLRQFAAKAAAQGDSKDFRVLDAGAGAAPFRDLFDHVTYETADFNQVQTTSEAQQDYVCDLTEIPVSDASFDLILCTQVMEHVPDPIATLREFHRVLKPGGQAWISAPLFFMEHQKPYDFHRFTQFAWKRMATESGFTIKELKWLEGYYGTLAYQATIGARSLPNRWIVWRVLLAILARQMTHAEMKKKVHVGMPKNYRVVFVKP
jgi:SAM-dependent methyltransferase